MAKPVVDQRSIGHILWLVAHQGCDVGGVDRCAVLLLDEAGDHLYCARSVQHKGVLCPPQGTWRVPLTPVEALWRAQSGSRSPLILRDTEDTDPALRALMRQHDAHAVGVVPLCSGSKLVGVLTLDSPGKTHAFAEQELAAASTLAGLLVVALENATPTRMRPLVAQQPTPTGFSVCYPQLKPTHRFGAVKPQSRAAPRVGKRARYGLWRMKSRRGDSEQDRQLRRVESGLRALTTEITQMYSPQQILEAVVEHSRTVFLADAASAWLVNATGELILLAASGFSDAYLAIAQTHHKGGPGAAVLTGQQAVYIADRAIQDDPIGRAAAAEGIRTMLFLPMLVEGKPIGMLILAHHTIHAYPEELTAQAEGFARQAALAIYNAQLLLAREELASENVRLYQVEAARVRQLHALLGLSERLHSTSNLDTLLQEVVDAVTSTLGFRVAVLNVRGERSGQFVARAVSGIGAANDTLTIGTATDEWELLLRPEFRKGRCYLVPPEYSRSLSNLSGFVFPDLPVAGPGEWDAYNLLFVPIGGEGLEALAVLSVDDPVDRKLPSNATLAALEAFAAHAALALQKAQLYAEVQRQASELEAVINNMADGVMLGTPDGHIRALNAMAKDLLAPGGRLADLEHTTLRDAEGTSVRADQLPLARALAGEQQPPMDLVVAHSTLKEDWLSISAAPIRDAAGNVVAAVSVLRDVNAERKLEQLRRSFLAVVSHELRTPLSAVIGYGELLWSHWAVLDEDRKRQMLGYIRTSSARLERLVQDLLLVSQIEAGQLRVVPEALHLEPLARQAVAEALARFPNQPIEVEPPYELVPVWADSDRTQQVLSNLVNNAAKYAGAAGPISICWRRATAAVEIRVIDHGAGVQLADRTRLFTRFGKLDQRQMRGGYVGIGLGLYITKQLVEAMQGVIWYEETPGGGSTFAVRLPGA